MIHKAFSKLMDRLEEIENKRKYFSLLSDWRFRNEKLVQLEFLKILSDSAEEYLPEKPYNKTEPRGKKCDIWVKYPTREMWIEVKVMATSYHIKNAKINHRKAISYQKKKLFQDIERLKNLDHGAGFLTLIVYPLFEDRERIWVGHKDDIESEVSKVTEWKYINLELGRLGGVTYGVG